MGVSWRVMPMRAGQIGPIRREIIFEPVHEEPLPVIPVTCVTMVLSNRVYSPSGLM